MLEVVDRALAMATPDIGNSDQGSHFTSPQYIDRLLARDVRVSMDGRNRALDNIFTERLWRTVKYENVYLADYETPRAARLGLSSYLEFYDLDRPHQALGYRMPAEVYFDADLARPSRGLRPGLRQEDDATPRPGFRPELRLSTPPELFDVNRHVN
ncbi:MAG: transposase [Chloroflexi bacterium]|nr:transposase [Chloroflexota bacterium]